jgi:lipid II:glycine glycyltransferase (peptidoglycan interpeptide bridge formation enzyme)
MIAVADCKITYKVVHCVSRVEVQQWNEFVVNHQDGNAFQTYNMYQTFKQSEGFEPIFMAVFAGDELKGILLAAIQTEASGFIGKIARRIVMRGGPLVEKNNEEVMDLLLQEYNKRWDGRLLYTQVRNWADTESFKLVFEKNNFKYINHLNLLSDLKLSEEQLWKRVSPRKRNRIRKARREHVKIVQNNSDEYLEQTYRVLEDVYNRVHLPYASIDYFKNLKDYSDKEFKFLIFAGLIEDEIIAFQYLIAYKNVLYAAYVGAKPTCKSKCSNDLINWEVQMWGKENGYEIFDFGGAGNPDKPYGVRDYKMKFGGVPDNIGRYEKVHQPIFYLLARIVFKVWRIIKIILRKFQSKFGLKKC